MSNWVSKVITVDLTTPLIDGAAPTGATNDTTPLISGQFAGSGADVETNNVYVYLDGGSGQQATATTSAFSLTVSPALTDGLHSVRVTATNSAGQGGKTWSFLVDSVTPTLTLNAGPSGPTHLLVSWPGSDASPSSGISSYDVQYKIGSDNWTDWLTNTTETSALFQATLAQTYTFRAHVTDKAGNVSGWVETGVVEVSPVTKYYLFGSQRVAMRQGSQVYYLHGDHLGSTSLTTDQSGAVVAQVRYLPYGEERWRDGASPTDFGFTSQRNEAGFGLYDYNARYYSPYLNRFISPDTVVPEPGSSGGFNRYRYARNNPLRYTDPSGHQERPWLEQLIRGIHGWVCSGWNSVNGCPGDVLLEAFDALPERPAPEDMAGPLLIDPEELDAVEAAQEGMEQAEQLGQMASMTPPVNSRGEPYPDVEVEGYGKVPFPNGPITVTDPQPLRDEYTSELRKEFRDQWYDKYGWYPSPDKYEIHHIKPLSRGGTNDFDNLVPLKIETEDQEEQHQQFTNWWRDYP